MGALAHEGMALKDTEKITIGICSPGYVVTDFLTSLLDVARSQKQLGQFISLQGSGVISRLRNQVVSTFMEKTTDDWLLQIDTDQRFTVNDFKKLVAAADAKTRPIVSAVVHGGWRKAHKTIVLHSGLDIKDIGINPEDSQLLDSRRMFIEDLCRIWNIPSHMMNLPGTNTYSSVEATQIEFVTHTLSHSYVGACMVG